MLLAVLADVDSSYARDLERAARERGHDFVQIDFDSLVSPLGCMGSEGATRGMSRFGTARIPAPDGDARAGYSPGKRGTARDLSRVDAILVRTMPPGSLEQVVYRMDALARLEALGIPVVNSPRSLECAVDKFLTSFRLARAGLPIPETVVCERADDALACFEQLGGDVVVKPIFGSEGRGILRVSDPDLAVRVFKTLERLQAVAYLQRYIAHAGFDIRVMVLDGKVLGAMQRVSSDDFRTNVSRNGAPLPHVPTPRECEWGIAAAREVGAHIAGIDILYDAEGRGHVIEVNAVPGWKAFRKVTGIDVADRLIESLEPVH